VSLSTPVPNPPPTIRLTLSKTRGALDVSMKSGKKFGEYLKSGLQATAARIGPPVAALEKLEIGDNIDPYPTADAYARELLPDLLRKKVEERLVAWRSTAQTDLAELRAYKRPPKAIHKAMRGILRVLLRLSASDVEVWEDCANHLKYELIGQMQAYTKAEDPNPDKAWKTFFNEVKGVPYDEMVKHGSKAAQVMLDWLLTTLLCKKTKLMLDQLDERHDEYHHEH